MPKILFAIIKVIDSEFHFAETTKNEYIVSSPEEFNLSILTGIDKILDSEKDTYTKEEFGEAYAQAFNEWAKNFKQQTIYMR